MEDHNDGRGGKGKGKGKRGSVRNDRRLAALAQRRTHDKADWLGCAPERLQGVVHGVTTIGGAVTFGTSRDGGAYSVTIMLDGERETLWFNGDANLDDELQAVVETLDALA